MDIVRNSVDRLVSCGVPDAEAWRIVKDFMKNYYGTKELMEDAPDERTKMEFHKFSQKIENM